MSKIIANQDTWLKKDWQKQASQLDDTERAFVPVAKSYQIEAFWEQSLEISGDAAAHGKVVLAHKAGQWWIYVSHWDFSWDEKPLTSLPPNEKLPDWNEIDWTDFSQPVSRYFTVGEVSLYQRNRIVRQAPIQQNAVKIARYLDKIREWWGSPLLVNSWYRPPDVERAVGGSGANHPYGFAGDIRPQHGSIWDFQQRFENEWYNAGKWNGGFGRGARRGFIHLDLRHKRVWSY